MNPVLTPAASPRAAAFEIGPRALGSRGRQTPRQIHCASGIARQWRLSIIWKVSIAAMRASAPTRPISICGDGLLEEMCKVGKEKMTVNFKNGLAIRVANLEELVLTRGAALAKP